MSNISFIIPTYKDSIRLTLLLKSIEEQVVHSIDPSALNVIIINNDSEMDLIVQRYDFKIQVINETEPGSYTARNAGIRHNHAEWLYFIDSDCLLGANSLKCIIDLTKSSKDQIHCGCVEVFKGNACSFAYSYEKHLAFDFEEAKVNGVGWTANMLVPRELIEHVGDFDSNLKSSGDVEFCARVKKKGYAVRHPENLKVLHPSRETLRQIADKQRRIIGGRFVLLNRRAFILEVLKPPLRRVKKIIVTNGTLLDKLKAITVLVYVKLISLQEACSLLLSFSVPKR
jgi:GT2 family glycosyltransferase